jgi:hypothetical protein
VLHNVTQTQNDPSLDEVPKFRRDGLQHTTPRALARSVASLAKGTGYLVIAPSMERFAEYYGAFTPSTLPTLVSRLRVSPYWQVWYQNGETVIFRAWPRGRPADKAAHLR